MKLRLVALALCALGSVPAVAEVEKVSFLCGQQMCFRWWPKVPPVQGWQHDRDHSLHYNFNALSPRGSSFATAETVMYANAVYKPRVPEAKSLAAFIEGDLKRFQEEAPGLRVEQAPAIKTADGNSAMAYSLKPAAAGQWERIAYFEEGEYYMVFVASSRSEAGLLGAAQAYEAMVSGYREKP